MMLRALCVCCVAAALLGAGYVNKAGAISVVKSCPLKLSAVTLATGKGFDRDSLYANFVIANTTAKEFLFTYKLQVRTPGQHSEVREQVGSSPILAHSSGTYREFVGIEFTNPGRYTLQQAVISCVSTGP